MGESHGSEEFDLWLEENWDVVYSPERGFEHIKQGSPCWTLFAVRLFLPFSP